MAIGQPPIGQVSVIHKGEKCEVEWELDFASLSETNGEGYMSPLFSFEGEPWYMTIYPNGRISGSLGYITLGLRRESDYDHPMKVQLSFSFKTLNGRKEFKRQATNDFTLFSLFVSSHFLSRSDFERRRSEFLSPSGMLTVVCTLKRLDSAGSTSNVAVANCSYCEKSFGVPEISSHERKCRVKCPHCSDVILLQNWDEHECQRSGSEDGGHLCDDIKKVLLNGRYHDLTLKVGDKELRAHRDILSARSKVFEKMLGHDTEEKKSGFVDIPDCDPQAMEQFLLYIYSGKVDTLDESNMLQLYYVADKYDTKGLKEQCLSFIQKSISSTNFYDIIQLALNHNDTILMEHATKYFTDNILDIMDTPEWQIFMRENSRVAHELTIKSVKKFKRG